MTYIQGLILGILIVLLLFEVSHKRVHAGTAHATLTLQFTVKPMCSVDGVIIPVKDKAECLERQRTGEITYETQERRKSS